MLCIKFRLIGCVLFLPVTSVTGEHMYILFLKVEGKINVAIYAHCNCKSISSDIEKKVFGLKI